MARKSVDTSLLVAEEYSPVSAMKLSDVWKIMTYRGRARRLCYVRCRCITIMLVTSGETGVLRDVESLIGFLLRARGCVGRVTEHEDGGKRGGSKIE